MRGRGLELWDEDAQQLVDRRVPSWGPQTDGQPAWGDGGQVHAVDSYHECRAVLADQTLESQIENHHLKQSSSNLLFLDGPEHDRLRAVISRALPSWRLTAASTTRFIEQLVDGLPDRARLDLVSDFAEPIAEHTSRTMLGLPPVGDGSGVARLAPVLSAMSAQFDPGSDDAAVMAGLAAGHQLLATFRLAIRTRDYPEGSALDHLDQARRRGELSVREMLASLVMLAHASFQNTANLLGFAAVEAMTNPEALSALRGADDSDRRRCVEELLRLGSPARFLIRRASSPRSGADRSIEEGDLVIPCLGLANRDPSVFAQPDQLDLSREGAAHLAFGAGEHACMGAALARAETLASISALASRYRTLTVESVSWGSNAVMYGPVSVIAELSV